MKTHTSASCEINRGTKQIEFYVHYMTEFKFRSKTTLPHKKYVTKMLSLPLHTLDVFEEKDMITFLKSIKGLIVCPVYYSYSHKNIQPQYFCNQDKTIKLNVVRKPFESKSKIQ